MSPANMTLEDLDNALTRFKAAVWSLPEAAGHPPADRTGATIETDLEKYVLTDVTVARIGTLYAHARDAMADSKFIPQAAYTAINEVMMTESCRLLAVASYWRERQTSAYHQDMIQKLVGQLPSSDRAPVEARLRALSDRIDELHSTLPAWIAACPSFPPQSDSDELTAIMKDYNALRQQTRTTLFELQPDSLEPARVKRTSACQVPAPAPPSVGDSRFQVVSRKDLQELFPREAIDNEVEGDLRVRVVFDTTGCVVEAAVVMPSGSDALDRAGLEYGFGLVFRPGTVNGKPVGERVNVPIHFKLD